MKATFYRRLLEVRVRIFPVLTLSAVLVLGSVAAHAEPTYDDLKKELTPQRVGSPAQLRKNLEAFDGAAVEFQGEITGIMVRPDGKVVMLKVGDDMALLSTAIDKNEPLLRTGNLVRIIARVNVNNKDGAPTILAVAAAADTSSQPATVPDERNDLSLPSPPPAPIKTAAPKPQPKPLTARGGQPAVVPVTPAKIKPQPKPESAGPGSLTGVSPYDVDNIVDEQKPAYAAIVRKHNKKLRYQVVDEIAEALLRAGYKYQMDPRFLAAIIAVESDFDVNCLSGSGAMGLGQLMPFNLKEAGVQDPWNPTQNVFGTAKLLRGHLDDYKNRPNGTLLAVAAYNAGPGAVRRAGYKVPNGAQVQRYVWKVYYRYKAFAPDMF